MDNQQVEELILQSLEHELGGVKVYTTAIECAVNSDLKEEWKKYLEETKTHVEKLEEVCATLGLDAKKETPGRAVVRHVGGALVGNSSPCPVVNAEHRRSSGANALT